MPVVKGPLSRPELANVQRLLSERISRRVTFDVWTRAAGPVVTPDRDPGVHAEDVAGLIRQICALHPALTVTPYDLDRHADRAREAGITMSPTTVLRSTGRSIHLVGYFSGALFQGLLDLIWLISSGQSSLTPASRAALGTLEAPLSIEALVTPYDPFSVQMTRLLGALAVESKHVHVRIIEIAEFERLAEQRMVSEVPVLSINGRRSVGLWNESTLMEQIGRVLTDDDEPVVRDRVFTAPYISEAQARAMASQPPPAAPGGRTASGLIVP